MANPTNKTKESFVPKEVDAKTVNLFFDGTKNNMFNTDVYDKNIHDVESSYANAYSNVAWMFNYRNEKVGEPWIYIEGIGSLRGDTNDEILGYATGIGVTGVAERAKQAFGEIERELVNKPSTLYINVFGFSRGAATASHFIHLAKSNPSLFRRWKLRSNQIRFKFVGIFDTVSSVGGDLDFDDDVEELKLDFRNLSSADRQITKVFHIIAADEYRENFSVTNINSAIGSGFGYEVTMNGAHADVGGAYHKKSKEDYLTTNKQLKDWLLQKNFYTVKEMKAFRHGRNPTQFTFIRDNIKNDIHKISLQMMTRMTVKYGKLAFQTGLATYYKKISGSVKSLMINIPNQVISEDPWQKGTKKGKRLTKTLPENTTTKSLRHNYIHWSVKNSTGFDVRLKNKVPSRQIISG